MKGKVLVQLSKGKLRFGCCEFGIFKNSVHECIADIVYDYDQIGYWVIYFPCEP